MSGIKTPADNFMEIPESEYYMLRNRIEVEKAELWSYRIAKIMAAAAELINYDGVTCFVEYAGHVKQISVRILDCSPEEYDSHEPIYRKDFYWDDRDEKSARFDYEEILENLNRAKFDGYVPYHWNQFKQEVH